MKLLAVETSTDACSAALFLDGEIHEQFTIAPRAHTRLLLPMIERLMADAQLKPCQLDALAFSRGPGSFTGVRIATGVAQGIAYGADLPVVPVSTLAAIAQSFFNRQAADVAFVGLDARIEEVFWGVYQRNAQGFACLIGEEAVTSAAHVQFPEYAGYGIGSAWAVYLDTLQQRLGHFLLASEAEHWPRAAAVAQLGADGFLQGAAVAVEQAMPVYLRDKVAKTETERAMESANGGHR